MKHLFSCGKPEHADPEYVYCRCYWDQAVALGAEMAALRERQTETLRAFYDLQHQRDAAEAREAQARELLARRHEARDIARHENYEDEVRAFLGPRRVGATPWKDIRKPRRDEAPCCPLRGYNPETGAEEHSSDCDVPTRDEAPKFEDGLEAHYRYLSTPTECSCNMPQGRHYPYCKNAWTK